MIFLRLSYTTSSPEDDKQNPFTQLALNPRDTISCALFARVVATSGPNQLEVQKSCASGENLPCVKARSSPVQRSEDFTPKLETGEMEGPKNNHAILGHMAMGQDPRYLIWYHMNREMNIHLPTIYQLHQGAKRFWPISMWDHALSIAWETSATMDFCRNMQNMQKPSMRSCKTTWLGCASQLVSLTKLQFISH